MTKLRQILALAALCVIGAGCADDAAQPPMPGTLLVSLSTPAADDGAVMVKVTGPGITSIQPTSSSQQLFWRLVSDNEVRAIVVGGVARGPLLLVQVADVNSAAQFTAEIGDVAGGDDAVRSALTGYALTVTRSGVQ